MDRDRATDRSTTIGVEDVGDLHRELDRLRADLRQIRTDLSNLGGDATRAARAGLNDATRAAAARGKAVAEAAEGHISSHPFLSVAGAFAAGMVLGMRLTRKPG